MLEHRNIDILTPPGLIARDERKNPLISTFDWTNDAVQRVFRVPAGFMRNKTQERVEELARERAVAAIDLALVEDGIEFGKKMMAEMIATYSATGTSPGVAATARDSAQATSTPAQEPPAGGGYLTYLGLRDPRRLPDALSVIVATFMLALPFAVSIAARRVAGIGGIIPVEEPPGKERSPRRNRGGSLRTRS